MHFSQDRNVSFKLLNNKDIMILKVANFCNSIYLFSQLVLIKTLSKHYDWQSDEDWDVIDH